MSKCQNTNNWGKGCIPVQEYWWASAAVCRSVSWVWRHFTRPTMGYRSPWVLPLELLFYYTIFPKKQKLNLVLNVHYDLIFVLSSRHVFFHWWLVISWLQYTVEQIACSYVDRYSVNYMSKDLQVTCWWIQKKKMPVGVNWSVCSCLSICPVMNC